MADYTFGIYDFSASGSSFVETFTAATPRGTIVVSDTNDTNFNDNFNDLYTNPSPGDTLPDPEGNRDQVIVSNTMTPGSVGKAIYTINHFTVTGSDGSEFVAFQVETDDGFPYAGGGNVIVTTQTLMEGVTYTINGSSPDTAIGGSGGNSGHGGVPYSELEPICFHARTRISTNNGDRPISELHEGDFVETLDGTFASIRWIGSRTLDDTELAANPNFRPIRIGAGALGGGVPFRDLLVSPQHRIYISNAATKSLFDVDSILCAAKFLTKLPKVHIANGVKKVAYFHMLFDKHEVVFAEGALAESLHPGKYAMDALGERSRQEIIAIFPELDCKKQRSVRPLATHVLRRPDGETLARNMKSTIISATA